VVGVEVYIGVGEAENRPEEPVEDNWNNRVPEAEPLVEAEADCVLLRNVLHSSRIPHFLLKEPGYTWKPRSSGIYQVSLPHETGIDG
jgi:hypothetical protein